ncbi:IS3 family transposase, partial [Streptomyces sp. CB02400]|uniref:IS3 family transposase n=1 Tax=Streptomyces sp. CB02400 TaxID=1703944 RepID=UPI0013011CE4
MTSVPTRGRAGTDGADTCRSRCDPEYVRVPRITRELRESGSGVNHKRIARMMRVAGLSERRPCGGKRTTAQEVSALKAPGLRPGKW